jgi:hypothetical protein
MLIYVPGILFVVKGVGVPKVLPNKMNSLYSIPFYDIYFNYFLYK